MASYNQAPALIHDSSNRLQYHPDHCYDYAFCVLYPKLDRANHGIVMEILQVIAVNID